MDGRLQNEMSIFKVCDKIASGMPSYVNGWYTTLRASRKTAATCRDYLWKVADFLSSINDDVKKVKPGDITESAVMNYFLSIQFKTTKNGVTYTSDSYQNTVWFCLNSFLKYMERAGLIKSNYMANVTRPKNHDLDRINERRILLTADDFVKILKAIDEEKDNFYRIRDKAIVLLFMNTGMRRTAMTTIMVSDVNFEDHELHLIDKGSKRHTYALNSAVEKAIKEWLKISEHTSDGHLFLSIQGNMLSTDTMARLVKKYTQIAMGKPISPHKLRSGYCSILYNKTGDIEFVRRCVGHSNVATTQRYIVTKGSEKERSSEIMGELLG